MTAKNGPAAQQRRTPGGIDYLLTRKPVKNLNLRLDKTGMPAVSAPPRAPLAQIDAFVDGHAAWLEKARAAQARRAAAQSAPPPDRDAALAAFTAMSEAVYPAFAGVLGGRRPAIRVRDMSSRWGVCNPAKRQITLALRLYREPPAAQIYVVVHEYCHFLVAGHGPAFWQAVARLLPDWKARRALLSDRANR